MSNNKFNLSKGEEKKESGFNLSKSSTVETPKKESGFNLSKTPTVETPKKDVTPSTPKTNESKPKSKLWLWLSLVAVAAIVVFFILMNKGTSNGDAVAQVETPITEQPTISDEGKPVNTEPVVTETPNQPTTPSTKPAEKPAAAPTAKPTQVSQGTIDEKAKQAIRGDFGNGAERKQALGSEYEAIQKKVNEIYRKNNQ